MALTCEQFNRIVGNADLAPNQECERLMLPDGTFTVERRDETRMPFGRRAKVRLEGTDESPDWSTVMLQDISLTGINFLGDKAQALGASFILCLKDDAGVPMSFRCVIQRCEPGGFGGTSFAIGAQFKEVLPEQPEQSAPPAADTDKNPLADPFEACGPGTAPSSPKNPRKRNRPLSRALNIVNPVRIWSHLTREYDDFSASGTGSKLPEGALTELAKTMEGFSNAPIAAPATPTASQSTTPRRSSIFLHPEPSDSTPPASNAKSESATTITEVPPMIEPTTIEPAAAVAKTDEAVPAISPADYARWSRRDLSDKRYVYMWAGELSVSSQSADPRVLVLLGAAANSQIELIALHATPTAPTPKTWKQLLANLIRRGITKPPVLAIGDRSLDFWPALADFSRGTARQFCWDHQITHILSLLPKGMQRLAQKELRAISTMPNREDAIAAFDLLMQDFQADAPNAAQCLQQDKEAMLALYSFPAADRSALKTCAAIHDIFQMHGPLKFDETLPMDATLAALLNLAAQTSRSLQESAKPLAA